MTAASEARPAPAAAGSRGSPPGRLQPRSAAPGGPSLPRGGGQGTAAAEPSSSSSSAAAAALARSLPPKIHSGLVSIAMVTAGPSPTTARLDGVTGFGVRPEPENKTLLYSRARRARGREEGHGAGALGRPLRGHGRGTGLRRRRAAAVAPAARPGSSSWRAAGAARGPPGHPRRDGAGGPEGVPGTGEAARPVSLAAPRRGRAGAGSAVAQQPWRPMPVPLLLPLLRGPGRPHRAQRIQPRRRSVPYAACSARRGAARLGSARCRRCRPVSQRPARRRLPPAALCRAAAAAQVKYAPGAAAPPLCHFPRVLSDSRVLPPPPGAAHLPPEPRPTCGPGPGLSGAVTPAAGAARGWRRWPRSSGALHQPGAGHRADPRLPGPSLCLCLPQLLCCPMSASPQKPSRHQTTFQLDTEF